MSAQGFTNQVHVEATRRGCLHRPLLVLLAPILWAALKVFVVHAS